MACSDRARRRMSRPGERPMFLADWLDVLFVHFAVEPEVLQPCVPFPLDLYRGRAYVSLVAFTQRRPAPAPAGGSRRWRAVHWREHEFLNVRTYVRHGRERGIYFLAEWIPNRLACLVGPRMYGLPYRLARSRYRCLATAGRFGRYDGAVAAPTGRLAWTAPRTRGEGTPGRRGLEHFLLERYTAYTRRGPEPLRFRVWHEPWLRVRARVSLGDTSLLEAAFPWFRAAQAAGALLPGRAWRLDRPAPKGEGPRHVREDRPSHSRHRRLRARLREVFHKQTKPRPDWDDKGGGVMRVARFR